MREGSRLRRPRAHDQRRGAGRRGALVPQVGRFSTLGQLASLRGSVRRHRWVVQSSGSRETAPEQVQTPLASCVTWSSYSPFLSLGLLNCKMKIIIVFYLVDLLRGKQGDTCTVPRTVSGAKQTLYMRLPLLQVTKGRLGTSSVAPSASHHPLHHLSCHSAHVPPGWEPSTHFF